MKKRIRFAAVFMTLAMLLSCSAFAAEKPQERVDLGNGFYMLVEKAECNNLARATGRDASKEGTVYYSGTKVGTMLLKATFTYGSSGVKVVSSSCSGSGANGWSAGRGTTSGSTTKVTGYCTFSKGSTKATGEVTLTCDKNGNIE